MASGYEVDPVVLTNASAKIVGCVGPVERVDVGSISGASEWYGHPGLYGALADFCNAWQVAITLLAKRSGVAGEQLKVAAQRYTQADESGSQAMGHIGHGLPPS